MNRMKISNIQHIHDHETAWHRHAIGQLFWVTKGILSVDTVESSWTLAPGCLGWIPAECPHRAKVIVGCQGKILRLDPDVITADNTMEKLVKTPLLIHAILLRLTATEHLVMEGAMHRLLGVLFDEISSAERTNFELPMPRDKRLTKLAAYLLSTPDAPFSKAMLETKFALSGRSISRLFMQQTGITFKQWRALAKLQHALRLLESPLSISDIALSCGYSSTSSFIYAFKQHLGETPNNYRKGQLSSRLNQS